MHAGTCRQRRWEMRQDDEPDGLVERLVRSRNLRGAKSAVTPRPMNSFVDPLLRSTRRDGVLTNTRNHEIVARTLLSAFDSASRRRGLLDHHSLEEGTALIIAPSNAIHTFSMRFAIDVAFVSRDGRVIKISRAVPPWRVAASWRGFAVVEFCAGALARSDTRPGDRLEVIPAERNLEAGIPLGCRQPENPRDRPGSGRG